MGAYEQVATVVIQGKEEKLVSRKRWYFVFEVATGTLLEVEKGTAHQEEM